MSKVIPIKREIPKTKYCKIVSGSYEGVVCVITYESKDTEWIRVTPLNADPILSLEVSIHNIQMCLKNSRPGIKK